MLRPPRAGRGRSRSPPRPAEISGPSTATATAAASALTNPLPADGALAASLGEFFDAYLAGVGEVDRYLSPGTALTPVSRSGYTSVSVDQAAADSDVADGAVPSDGTTVRVQAHVTAIDAEDGRWPLVYTLEMTARSGRWEVTALQAGAPPTTATAKASPTPTASATVAGGAAK